jgi:hypothetical protein
MTISESDSDISNVKEAVPVMPEHPAEEGGVSGQLARGSTPSTPSAQRSIKRLKSIKKYFRCTPAQDVIIKLRAADAGLEEAAFLRMQALGETKIRKVRRVRADWDELRRCMGVINKAGNVVNQLVKVLYLGGVRSDISDEALSELRKAARAVMTALGKG